MKNPAQERLRRQARQYHRHHTWDLEKGGVRISHLYQIGTQLSWWDGIGFVLNGRRVMVWWIHPRMKYVDAIGELALKKNLANRQPSPTRSSVAEESNTVRVDARRRSGQHASPAPRSLILYPRRRCASSAAMSLRPSAISSTTTRLPMTR